MTAATFKITPMECWITLPAIWSDEAKDATLAAAKKAGFGNREGDEVFTIAEPEAAAIATLKSFAAPDALNPIKASQNPKENILICDCGGGTIDITTYVVTQVSPYLTFDELHIGAGGKCGSTYVDRNLHSLLSEWFGSSFDELPFSQKGPGSKFMTSFETYKKSFGLSDDTGDIREIGPIRLDLPDSEHFDEDERLLILT
ncbi:Heat shock protein [Lachnellula arida]|uniref:Heat shock protein n=1 Tax=Lachnellula arida TaxID=1316785 RepID=A0A8T9BA39_9HELO|nr:Heat shock protein [Lachnellula arida]